MHITMISRVLRRLLLAVAASCLALGQVGAWAAAPVVEVIACAHPPVQSALKPLRDSLARQGTKVRVVEIDMDTPRAERRLQAVGLKGHLPVVVLVDGQYRHQRADGSTVEFVSFPAGPGTPPGVKGTWSAADVEAVLKARVTPGR
jgi:hypothetical protein